MYQTAIDMPSSMLSWGKLLHNVKILLLLLYWYVFIDFYKRKLIDKFMKMLWLESEVIGGLLSIVLNLKI